MFILKRGPQDLSAFESGTIQFEARSLSEPIRLGIKIDCVWPCTSGNRRTNTTLNEEWQRVTVSVDDLVTQGLDLTSVDTGLVFWPTNHQGAVIEIDNVKWSADTPTKPQRSDSAGSVGELTGPDSPRHYDGFDLVWSDEFSGDVLDSRYWNLILALALMVGATMSGSITERKMSASVRVSDNHSKRRRVLAAKLHLLPNQNRGPSRFHIWARRHPCRIAQRARDLAGIVVIGHELLDGRLALQRRDRHHGNDWRRTMRGHGTRDCALEHRWLKRTVRPYLYWRRILRRGFQRRLQCLQHYSHR